jgi:predicted PhzF superfamily epimerase YddE/YHI9
MYPFYVVNAFSQVAFKGNPAGVCMVDQRPSVRWMQSVAAEMGFSETAFVAPTNHHFHIRWFSPKVEVNLCGHATLAAAHVLWESGQVTDEAIHFTYAGGLLRAQRFYDVIEIAFPEDVPRTCHRVSLTHGTLSPSGIEVDPVRYLGLTGVRHVLRSREDLILVLSSEAQVRDWCPDMALVAALDVRAVVVTALSESQQYDIVSRVFAPRIGIPEDPVTGSAHCALVGYWLPMLQKPKITCFQASARGGIVQGRLGEHMVRIGGHAVTLKRGHWLSC